MKTNGKNALNTVWPILTGVGIVLLIPGLLYAGVLCWAWLSDLKNADIAQEIIDPKAAEYISQAYPDNDYVIDNAYYVFKDNCYRVKVHSPSSQDTYFKLDYDYKTYELVRDDYESVVLSGYNTRDRLVSAYTQLIDDCLSSATCLSRVSSDFCKYSEIISHGGYFSPNGLDPQTLVVDQAYNVAELGAAFGFLEVTAVLPKEEVDIRSALTILTEIDRLLTESGIGYSIIEITIVNAEYPDTTAEFHLYDVHPEDLDRENPLAYLQELWNSQEAHRQEIRKEWAD